MALVSKSSFTYNVTHQLCSSKRGTAQDCQKVFLIYLYNPRCRRMDMMPQTRQQGRTQWFNMAERMVIMHIIKLQKHRLAIFWKRWTSSGSYLSYGTMIFFLLLPTACVVFYLLLDLILSKVIHFWLILPLCGMQLKIMNFPLLHTNYKGFAIRKMHQKLHDFI